MSNRRLVVNLTAFVLAALALVAYGMVDLLGNPLQPPMDVSAVFPDASGLFQNFSVELDGVDVGSVTAVHLTRTGARVDMAIDHGTRVPGDVVASIDLANDLGEQVVELTPAHGGTAPPLRPGAVIPVTDNGVPAEVGRVVAAATRLLDAIPAGNLDKLLAELATALRGRAQDLRTIVSASTTFSQEFLAYQRQFDALLANAPPVMDAVTAAGPQLQQALVNTEALMQVLATKKTDLVGLLHNGSAATGVLGDLLTNQAPDLACLIHDTSELATNLDQPANLSHLSQSLTLNHYFFGAVNAVAVAGRAKPLKGGEPDNTQQTFLRTRLLLPPVLPGGDAYATQAGLPDVAPGAGCTTELGHGVGPATQAGFTPAAGGSLAPATAADAQVRGGGDPQPSPAPAVQSSFVRKDPPDSGVGPLLLGGLVLPALALAWGARPSRRRRRRRA
ncbi:MAG TPA: MCE family protein [Acidimicrobiales bacterium]|nr:MCE family protein [Acidimicrobiales bacterium]